MLTDQLISIVVVCYRDAGSITELLRRLEITMAEITPNWEVIYVNDDSPDESEAILVDCARNNPRLTVISHSRNFGAQTAFTTGMAQAIGDAVVIMDGDLQDPPEMIADFVRHWMTGNDVVYGIRAERNEGIVRNMGYKIFYRILKRISYVELPIDAGEFSLMDRVVVEAILACPEGDRLIRGLRAYAGFRQVGIPFNRPPRYSGESTQSLLSYLMWAYKSFTSYSLFPLRIITTISFIMTAILFSMIVFYLVLWVIHSQTPEGYMTILISQLLIGTVIMLALGIIGEYLGRMFLEIKARPQPIIRLLVNDQRPTPRSWLGRPFDPLRLERDLAIRGKGRRDET
ncbi:MAG: glycosyltransferase family 2 protein [Magnetococcales bacterium]|nr:glycosyltransferase family 2 protein [Magnetococcales bacterium]